MQSEINANGRSPAPRPDVDHYPDLNLPCSEHYQHLRSTPLRFESRLSG